MTGTTLTIVIILAVIVLAAVIVVGMRLARQKQTERLREQYGPEYDRAVAHSDNQRDAESELRDREKRHKDLDLRDLDTHEREGFERRWKDIQGDFVDDPSQAVRSADRLVVEVMGARGYPTDDFDQRADDLSVSHPKITQKYREARKVAKANADGSADTEDLRHAVTSYRELVHALLGNDDSDSHGSDSHGSASHRSDGAGSDNHVADHSGNRADGVAHDRRTDAGGPDTGRADMGKGDRDAGHVTDTNGHPRGDRENVRTQAHETERENS